MMKKMSTGKFTFKVFVACFAAVVFLLSAVVTPGSADTRLY